MRTSNIQPPLGTPINKSHPLSQGLVGCWTLNEGGGNKLVNALGSSLNDGVNNGSTWSKWERGDCLNFVRTSSQYISVTKSPFIDLSNATTPMTVSAWINTSNANLMTVMADWDVAVTPGWEFTISEFNAGKFDLLFANFNGSSYFGRRGSTNVNDGIWRHIVATYNGSGLNTGINLYVNGVLETMTNLSGGAGTTGTLTNANFRIGSRLLSGANNQFYDGKIAVPMIWRRELSATEVRQVYTNPYCMFLTKHRFIK